MEESAPVKKGRGWPKGKKRGPRAVATPAILPAPEPEAPIHVRLRLKGWSEPIEFGCAERSVENGFHVFIYPSERDRYRMTRREFAISEIVEVEITEARRVYDYRREAAEARPHDTPPESAVPAVPVRGPIIHSARQAALSALETSSGPIKMTEMPKIQFGDHAG